MSPPGVAGKIHAAVLRGAGLIRPRHLDNGVPTRVINVILGLPGSPHQIAVDDTQPELLPLNPTHNEPDRLPYPRQHLSELDRTLTLV
jgi:hypothetical protein